MGLIICFLVLLVIAYMVFAWGLSHWGSDSGFVIAAVVGGGLATALLSAFGFSLAAANVFLWLLDHVQVKVTL